MSENEAKHCFLRSLSCWSHKTLESNMSLFRITVAMRYGSNQKVQAHSQRPADSIYTSHLIG
jgi:hypothetical protein